MPTKDTIIRIDIPADHHPGMLKGDSLGTGIGREALAHIYDAYGKINDVARAVEDKGRLATLVQPFAETAIAKADTLLGKLRALDVHLRKTVNDALSPVQVPNERSTTSDPSGAPGNRRSRSSSRWSTPGIWRPSARCCPARPTSPGSPPSSKASCVSGRNR